MKEERDRLTTGSMWGAGFIALGVAGLVFLFQDARMLPEGYQRAMWGLRGVITGLLVIVGGFYIAYDKLGPGMPNVDRPNFDLWTVAHALFGVFLGIWYFPIVQTLVVTVLWEVFERYAAGWGREEGRWNYFVDLIVAWVGWFIVVGIVMIFNSAKDASVFFPFIAPRKFFWDVYWP